MDNEKNNKKAIITLVVGIGILFVLIFSATFAYFSVSSTNSFGSKTINATAEAIGSVALNGTNANLKLNLSAVNMMKASNDVKYWGTSDGTPSTTQNAVTIGSTQVTGVGTFNCNYTLSVTATGTNNMYTAFQGMSGKSTEQIVLKIGDTKYDFNTANLFPITINGTLKGVSSTSVKALTAEFYIVNKNGVNQDALQGKDINISISATNFSCTPKVVREYDAILGYPFEVVCNDPDNDIYPTSYDIEALTILNTLDIPMNDTISVLDISEEQNGKILASCKDVDSDGLYEVYVGQDGGVVANPNSSGQFVGVSQITGLNNLDTSLVTDMSHMFEDVNVSSLDLSSFDTSNVTDMSYMFAYSESLNQIIGLDELDTSSVTNMSYMFDQTGFSILDLTAFNTSHVTDMSYMFSGCSSLTSLDISSFSTSNVVDMGGMFLGVGIQGAMDLTFLDTSSVTNMAEMFSGCAASAINLSSFNTSSVTNMGEMFYETNLTVLDLSSFSTSNVTNMGGMFRDSYNLQTIYVSNNFVTNSVTYDENMFLQCDSLIGGSNTHYNYSHTSKTYARIDNPPSAPGYFTLKTS